MNRIMVRVLVGDLFESNAQTVVNTVNCVGVMGKGIALEFKKRFPDMFRDYEARCRRGEVQLGRPYLYKSLVLPWILNFPTKDHWRSVTRLQDIVRGLEHLLDHCQKWGIESLAFPPLGCGQGQLEWAVVGPTLYRYLSCLRVPVEIYAPYGTAHEELQPEFFGQGILPGTDEKETSAPWFVKPAWLALVEILERIEQEPYHWPVGRTSFQKIAYVATQQGLPTELRYRRGSYGPFASGLKGIITRLLNNGLIREERTGRMFAVKVGPTFHDARNAYLSQLAGWDPIIERTADLFLRMNTMQAELVATILFVATQLGANGARAPSEREVLDEVKCWKQRRRPPLDEQETALTIRDLAALDWIEVTASADLPLPEAAVLGG